MRALFASCEDYFLMVSGKPADPKDAENDVLSLPPGKTPDDKLFLGLQQQDGSLAGVVDLVKDYPTPGTWYLGLLLLHPALRGQGHGEALHTQLLAWLKDQGGHAVRLGVLEQNAGGNRFWERLGYIEISRKPFQVGGLTHTVRVMERTLS
jgi:ribosomal protein S18 acetylase RimI-like enzyme